MFGRETPAAEPALSISEAAATFRKKLRREITR